MKMKFIIKQEILLESLNHTSRAISPRNLIPILTGIKFDLTEEGLYLSASDTDISIRCLIPTDKIEEVQELGSIVIGGKYIVEIIKKLPNTNIMFEVMDGNKMIVSTDNTEFNLNGINRFLSVILLISLVAGISKYVISLYLDMISFSIP